MREEQFGTQTPLYHKLHYNVRGQLYDVRLSTQSFQTDEWNWNRGMLINSYGSGDLTTAWGTSGPNNNGNVLRSHHYVHADDATSSWTLSYQDYTYDALNRLASATETRGTSTGGWAQVYKQSYDYDRHGNRTISQDPARTSGPVSNRQFSVETATNHLGVPAGMSGSMTYDHAGNLINDTYTGQGARTYDAENRMISAQGNLGLTSNYTYDADGRRVKRQSGSSEVWQVFGIDGELLAEYPAGNAPYVATKEYGYRAGKLLLTISSGDDQRLKRFVQNLYVGAFRRDATAAEIQQHTAALAGSGVQGQAALLQTAREIARSLFTQTNYELSPARTDEQFVTDLYYAYLQRGPDSNGLAWWTGQAACPSGQSCTAAQKRAEVCNGFEQSGEFITLVNTLWGTSTGDNERIELYIRKLYLAASGTEPTAAQLQQRTQELNTAAAQGQSQVVAKAEQIGRELFVEQVANPSINTNTQFITNLYEAFLQRGPDQGGLAHWPTQAAQNRQNVLNYFATYPVTRELAATLYREVNWLVGDHLGTPRMVVYKTGALAGIQRHDYLPFGEELGAGIGGRTTDQGYRQSDGVRQKFTSAERDDETGLDFMQARYFASHQGRFTSVDPLTASGRSHLPQSWNRYTYVLNNPLKYIDLPGQIEKEADGKTVKFVKTGSDTYTHVKDGAGSDGRYYTISWQRDTGYVIADNGDKIKASKAISGIQVTVKDSKGKILATGGQEVLPEDAPVYDNTSNCHGTTFADGQVWIANDQVKGLMKGDGYSLTQTTTPQQGDVAIYSKQGVDNPLAGTNPQHSARVATVNNGKVTGVDSKAGAQPKETNVAPGPGGEDTAWRKDGFQVGYYSKPSK